MGLSSALSPATLPLTRLDAPSYFESLLSYAPIKALIPIPVLLALAPVVIWFFRDTWRDLDAEATAARQETPPGQVDYRPAACLLIVAVVLTLQEYYGGRQLWDSELRPFLLELENEGWTWLKVRRYDELYGYAWWSFSRVLGYVLIPLPLWKLLFPKDSLLDMGLRVRGFMLGAMRRAMGSAAIFAMAVPYCMIHYGKPYLETHGAIVAGVVLGSLAMRTKSIYAGFLVHITVAYSMDLLALWHRDALPTTFWAP
jgi:hypothetical protein